MPSCVPRPAGAGEDAKQGRGDRVVVRTEEKLMFQSAHLPIPTQRRSIEDDDRHEAPAGPRPPAAALALLARARACLDQAEAHVNSRERFVAAHLAALRAATAVVVARSGSGEGAAPVSVWTLLTRAAPELGEWAALFASGSHRRAAAEAGIPGVTAREADALMGHATEFLAVVGRSVSGVAR
jgi:hypothetical protein